MAMTDASNPTSYLPLAEFTSRVDVSLVGNLLATPDSNGNAPTIPVSEWATNATLLAALLDASGLVESAALAKKMYTADDLAHLGGVSLGLFYRILTDVALAYLFDNRMEAQPTPGLQMRIERSTRWLDQLAAGEKIFSTAEAADAGVSTFSEISEDDQRGREGINRTCRRLMGKRSVEFEIERGNF